jgi:DNA mismatch repair protein MutS
MKEESTPLMRQYKQVKSKYPDTILLFRMGDFFETFEDDAVTASKVCGLTLTKRSNGAAAETPLAGFPHHQLDNYLPKLVKAGYRVAVCEQLEDPKFAKGIVKRDVIEVVTPGVAFNEKLLDTKRNNYLVGLYLEKEIAGIAFVDISTAEFGVAEVPLAQLSGILESLQPQEIVVSKRDREKMSSLLRLPNQPVYTKLDDWMFSQDYAREKLLHHFKTQSLKGFGIDALTAGVTAAGAVMQYLYETQKANVPHIQRIALYNPSEYMLLDAATRRNLELTFSTGDSPRDGSLISILDKTETPMGGRLLKKWLVRPLKKLDGILQRQEAVAELLSNTAMREAVIRELKETGDLERLIAKICTGRATPRDLIYVKITLRKIPKLKTVLAQATCETLKKMSQQLDPIEELEQLLNGALTDDPPLNIQDGYVIREQFNADLDSLRSIATSSKTVMAQLQQSERTRTGIASLKVDYNSVFGYYIEISKANAAKTPENYIRKQTLTNAERYITPELKELEEKILGAEDKIITLERDLFNGVRMQVAEHAERIQQNAQLIALLDCLQSMAETAKQQNYIRPEVNDGDAIEIVAGRHPVVESILPAGEQFTPNDCRLDNKNEQIWVITGPNMSGKSVFLRQTGLITLLAHIGSFVPAAKATIGLVDRIFTRVGASDNISAGESTFLVEMHEAANIVNNATAKSLILLDEIGRGTSTFDGVSIAWALTEYLHEHTGAKTLFATHYHELNELSELYPRVKNYKVDVREVDDRVIFLHKVLEGYADHSYGIQVAQMAGLPEEITSRAKEIMQKLEQNVGKEFGIAQTSQEFVQKTKTQISLFEVRDDKLREELKKLDMNSLTPLEALNKLADLKKQAEK